MDEECYLSSVLLTTMGGDSFVKPPAMPHALAESEQSPAKRPKMMNTPPAEADETGQDASSRLETRTKIKADIVSDNEPALTASWERLLCQLREEVDAVTQAGADIIPVIDFEDLRYLALPTGQRYTHTGQRLQTTD